MTRLEARIRQRLRPLGIQVFRGDERVFDDADVVKWRRRGDGVHIWTFWADGVNEWWFPRVDEVRIEQVERRLSA